MIFSPKFHFWKVRKTRIAKQHVVELHRVNTVVLESIHSRVMIYDACPKKFGEIPEHSVDNMGLVLYEYNVDNMGLNTPSPVRSVLIIVPHVSALHRNSLLLLPTQAHRARHV